MTRSHLHAILIVSERHAHISTEEVEPASKVAWRDHLLGFVALAEKHELVDRLVLEVLVVT